MENLFQTSFFSDKDSIFWQSVFLCSVLFFTNNKTKLVGEKQGDHYFFFCSTIPSEGNWKTDYLQISWERLLSPVVSQHSSRWVSIPHAESESLPTFLSGPSAPQPLSPSAPQHQWHTMVYLCLFPSYPHTQQTSKYRVLRTKTWGATVTLWVWY